MRQCNHIPPIDYDLFKGLLSVFVIIGHVKETIPNGIIQIIYWFHMPCFFILSGWQAVGRISSYTDWTKKKIKRLLVPQLIWFVVLTGLQGRLDLGLCKNFLKGARNIGGVYWFVPILFASLLLFEIAKKICGESLFKMDILFCIVYGTAAYIQCNIWEKIESEKVSFSVGIMLLCLTYMYIGYRIRLLHDGNAYVPRMIPAIAVMGIFLTIVLYKTGTYKFNLNLAGLNAGDVGLNLLIPSCFMVCLIIVSDTICKMQTEKRRMPYLKWVRMLGRNSLLVMYLHKYILNDVVEVWLGDGANMWLINTGITIVVLLVILIFLSVLPAKVLQLLGGRKAVNR